MLVVYVLFENLEEKKKKTLGDTFKKIFCYLLCTLLDVCIFQATAEQIRLAQMIYDKNDADFEDKVKQVCFLWYRVFMPCNKLLQSWLTFLS